MNFGILGCGFSGLEIARQLSKEADTVWGTTRSKDKFSKIEQAGGTPVLFDGEELNAAVIDALKKTTHLVISIAPPRQENIDKPDDTVDPVLRAMEDYSLKALAPDLKWIVYLSTVGVYGNHDGAWIDETAELGPTSSRSRQRVRAEAEWLQIGEASDIPVAVFRLSGIYGPGRNGLVNASKGTARRLVKKDQVFNRIHIGDIAQATQRAAEKCPSGLFNITDNEPAPPQDVVVYAHELLGLTPPPEIDFNTADLSPMARSFYGENKRVSNEKSKKELGMNYDWGDYKIALKRMVEEDTWRG